MRLLTNTPRDIEKAIREPKDQPLQLASFTVSGAPDAAAWPRGIIYVSNESGGATIAFSDGTNWRRVQDRAIIS